MVIFHTIASTLIGIISILMLILRQHSSTTICKRNRFSFLIALLFSLSIWHTPSYAQSQEVIHGVDSCRALLPKQSADERLVTYQAMQSMALFAGLEYELEIARAFESEAIAQNNIEMIGLAKYRKVSVYTNHNETDKGIQEAEIEMEQCRKKGAMKGFYQLLNLKGERMLFQGKPLAALNFISPLFEEARKSNDTFGMASCADILGQIYVVTGDLTQSEKYLREAIEHYTKLGDGAIASKLDTYFKLSNTLLTTKRYDDVVALTHDYEALLTEALAKNNKEVREIRYALCFFLRGIAAHHLGEEPLVIACYDKMGHYTNNGEKMGELYSVLKMCADAAKGDFAAAHAYADQLIEVYEKAEIPMGTLSFLTHKATFYSSEGKYEQANKMLNRYIAIANKVREDQSLQQQNEFSTLYELEKKESHRRLLTSWLIGIGVSCLMLAVALGLFIHYNRLLRSRNKILCQQIEEALTAQRKMEQMRRASAEQRSASTRPDELSLIERLDELMRTQKLYTRPELSRDSIATELATNRTYLNTAIREAYNQTFPEYITEFRLSAAIGLIEMNREKSNMQSIAEEVGYNNYTTFYRSFIKRYGVKPMDYVNFLNSKEAPVIETE